MIKPFIPYKDIPIADHYDLQWVSLFHIKFSPGVILRGNRGS